MQNQQTIIITGGGQGIGKVSSKYLLTKGHKIIILEDGREAGMEAAEELNAVGDFTFIHCDITQEDQVLKAIEKVYRFHNGIDVLINNAAIAINKSMQELTLQEWNKVLAVNLTGTFLSAKYAARHLKEAKGSIINICSTRAQMSEPNTEAYTASKGGIYALTHAMAVSLGPEVRVNSISPGWIDVSMNKKSSIRKPEKLTGMDHLQHPAGRVGQGKDIARMIEFLMAPKNNFITGQNFVVDGGMTKKMIYV